MANICDYKIKVKGPRNACYAFIGSTSAYDDKEIISEAGTEEETVIVFRGCCKWAIDMYCHAFNGEKPVTLPKNADEAYSQAEDLYWYHTVKERSEMFQVEVWCNSGSAETFESSIYALLECGELTLDDIKENNEFTPYMYEHYKCGEEIFDNMPEEISIPFSFEDNEDWEEEDDE